MTNIILAHGWLGFRSEFGIEYFNGVKEYFEQQFAANVVATQVNPVRGVIYRGEQLRRQILIALGEVSPDTKEETEIAGKLNPDKPIHLISHSMGGLDCRFVISPAYADNVADKVATLSTIGGPHRGTPSADLMYAKLKGHHESLVGEAIQNLAQGALDLLHISIAGLHDMCTENAAEFNRQYVDNSAIEYFSYAGEGYLDRLPTCKEIYWSYKYIKKQTGEVNDGAVPVSSAKWGTFSDDLWPLDHPGLIGHDANHFGLAPKGVDYLARYGAVLETVMGIG